jgi:hypothetical protein
MKDEELIDELILAAKDYVFAHGNQGHVEKLLAARSAVRTKFIELNDRIDGLHDNLKQWEEKYYSMTMSNGKSVQVNAQLLEINNELKGRIAELEEALRLANEDADNLFNWANSEALHEWQCVRRADLTKRCNCGLMDDLSAHLRRIDVQNR